MHLALNNMNIVNANVLGATNNSTSTKTTVLDPNTSSGTNQKTFVDYSPATTHGSLNISIDGAVGRAGNSNALGLTNNSASTASNASTVGNHNTNVGTKKKTPAQSESLLRKQFDLEDTSMALLQEVLQDQYDDKDLAIQYLDELREGYYKLKHMLKDLPPNDANLDYAFSNARKIKLIQMSIRGHLCPPPTEPPGLIYEDSVKHGGHDGTLPLYILSKEMRTTEQT